MSYPTETLLYPSRYKVLQVPGKTPLNQFDAYGKRLPGIDFFGSNEILLNAAGVATETLSTAQPCPPKYWLYESLLRNRYLNDRTILVSHSAGAGASLRFLSENKHIRLTMGIFAATSRGKNWSDEDRRFFEGVLDPALITRMARMVFIHSTNDTWAIRSAGQEIIEVYPDAEHVFIKNGGHLTFGTTRDGRFPEITSRVTDFILELTSQVAETVSA